MVVMVEVLKSRILGQVRRRQRAGLLMAKGPWRVGFVGGDWRMGRDGVIPTGVVGVVVRIARAAGSRRMGIRREVHQMHRRCRGRLCRDAGQLATDASPAWLRIVTFDSSNCARATGVRDTAGTGGSRRAPTLLGRVVVVVGNMAAEEVLAGEGFLANLTDKASAKGMGLDMSDEMFWARIRSSTIAAGIEVVAAMIGLRSRGSSRGGGSSYQRRWHSRRRSCPQVSLALLVLGLILTVAVTVTTAVAVRAGCRTRSRSY